MRTSDSDCPSCIAGAESLTEPKDRGFGSSSESLILKPTFDQDFKPEGEHPKEDTASNTLQPSLGSDPDRLHSTYSVTVSLLGFDARE